MRALRTVRGPDVLGALRDALAGGDAVHPLADDAPEPAGPPREVPQRVALVVGTSGSSGAPKRVALSADALLASAAAAEGALGGPGGWLLALPAHYIAGINVLTRSIAAGTEPVAVDPHLDPDAFVAAVARLEHPLALTSLVPAQLGRLLDVAGPAGADRPDVLAALRRFDRILIGGQRMPDALAAAADDAGLAITRTYGSSETGGGCVYDGAPIGDTRVRIRGDEVELAGSVLAEGYLDDRVRTADRFTDEAGGRWYRTGDTGAVVDGRLVVTGRLDDVIISGGLKVALGEVERRVRALPGQADAVVLPVDNGAWGRAPAVVTTAPVDDAALRAATAPLGPQARPVAVHVVDAIPLLDSGKPDRVALRALVARG